jgi:hypothetical protein
MIDEGYATRLLGDPVATLRTDGINVPDGVEVIAVRETGTESIVIIPTRPPDVELGDNELDDTAIILRESLEQTQMSDGSWPFRCSNPPTWCPSCQKD